MIDPNFEDPEHRMLRTNGRLIVVLFDFDLAVIMPPNRRRLPAQFSFQGLIFDRPPDTFQGEYDYDPYAFDVACLANVLLAAFEVRVSLRR